MARHHANHEYVLPRANLPFWYQNFHNDHAEYVAPHWHEAIEILYVYRGLVTGFMIDQQQYTVAEGQMLVVPSEAVHAVDTPPMFHESISLQFPHKMIAELYPQIQQRQFITNDRQQWKKHQKQAYKQLQPILQKIFELTATPLKSVDNILITALAYQALYILINGFTIAASSEKQLHRNNKLVVEIVDFIEEHLKEPLSLTELAAQLNYSKDYLSRRFKQETGMTIHHYLICQRARQAYYELQQRNAPLYIIAHDCGFNSLRSMDRALKVNYQKTAFQIAREQ